MGPNGITYLYYVNTDSNIWRSIRDQAGDWGIPTQLNVPPVDAGSQMSVTTDAKGKFNHLYFIANGDFTEFPDPVVPPMQLLGANHAPTLHLGDPDKPHFDLHLGHPGELPLQWSEGHTNDDKDKKPAHKPEPGESY